MAFLVGGANSAADTGPYDIDNSCRFETDTYMTKSISSGNTRTFTLSFWVKTTLSSGYDYLASFYQDGSNRISIGFYSDDTFFIFAEDGGEARVYLKTDRLFRDPAAWYHIAIAIDTTQGTDTNRAKLYVNGVQETSFSTATYPDEDQELILNTNFYVGTYNTSSNWFGGYMAEYVYIDGTALAPSSFGETDEDSGIWKPINVSGLTFGTNGFYLDFEASDNLGNDANGGTDLTETNLAATDQTTDTPTNNFCTMNPLDNYWADAALAEGNLQVTTPSTNGYYSFLRGTMGVASGKWYWEVKAVSTQHADSDYGRVGFAHSPSTGRTDYLGRDAHPSGSNGYGLNGHGGGYYYAGSAVTIDAGGETGYRQGEILHFALDLDNNKIWWGIDGTWLDSGDPTSGATGTGADAIVAASSQAGGFYSPAIGDADSGGTYVFSANFGNPAFAISSGNADDNGYGNFEFDVPTGFYALCTKNLAEFG